MKISVVVPFYNEEDNVREMHARLKDVMDKIGETYAVVHRDRHRWFYFPQLRPDEVVLLKIYDSKVDGPVRLSAHTAFEDPTSPPGAPARRSIELRALVFYPS